ncbi:MAG: SPOR domain-containing protein [Desulfuromonadaceae bacterium]|nr:SPOR domain-containing protein [Desulfuromonadaceae bacterium]
MDIKFSKDSDTHQQQGASGEQKNQSSLLVLLLILVGGFGYIYFFTDLIKPREEQKSAAVQAPAPQAQTVKMPLPPRTGEPAEPAKKPPVKAEAAAPKPTAAPAVKAAAPSLPPAKTEQKKVVETKPAEKKIEQKSTADKKVAVPKAEEKKTAVTDRKSTPLKDAVKKGVSGDSAKPGAQAKSNRTVSGPWSLVVGNYVLEEVLSADMGRVRKAGFEPVVKPSARKKTTMNRLFVAEFTDRASAQATLEKLKKHTSDAFVLEQGGKFDVYAGSYLQGEAARSEKDRLKSAGYSATIKHADIAIPSQSLSVGPFSSRKAAENALGKLKGAGMKATLSQK